MVILPKTIDDHLSINPEMLTDRLKEATKVNHQLLERKLVGKMKAIRSVDDYSSLLAIFYQYFGGLEKLIAGQLDQSLIPDYNTRRKSAALTSDLIDLGAMIPSTATTSELPAIKNHRQALGALYVIEGSTLGGQIISNMIKKQLPSIAGHGLTFFDGYGENTADMWERFKLFIDKEGNLDGDQVIDSANETFLKFSDYFH